MAETIKTQFEIIAKDAKTRRVYGWFSVAKDASGKTLVDRHGDVIEVPDLEVAAAEFVKEYRAGGIEHDGGAPHKLIASIVFSPEVQKALGVPDGVLPQGWFGGFEIPEDVFKKVASGALTMFSIEGEAAPEEIEIDATAATVASEVAA